MRSPAGIAIFDSREESDWVKHAARLRGMSWREYVRRAVNERLQRDGVDAVLLRERHIRPKLAETRAREE